MIFAGGGIIVVLDNVDIYTGQHSISFTVDGVTKNTWSDWGLIPSSRHSEPVYGIWSQKVSISGVNGQEDLVRKYPYTSVNSNAKLKESLNNDNRERILSESGYDIYQPTSGSFSFIIADQNVSFFRKEQEILNFLHNRTATMIFADDPSKVYKVRVSVGNMGSGSNYSSVSISYTVITET